MPIVDSAKTRSKQHQQSPSVKKMLQPVKSRAVMRKSSFGQDQKKKIPYLFRGKKESCRHHGDYNHTLSIKEKTKAKK